MSLTRKLSIVTPSGTLVPSSNITSISEIFTSLPGAILLRFIATPEAAPRAVSSSVIFSVVESCGPAGTTNGSPAFFSKVIFENGILLSS